MSEHSVDPQLLSFTAQIVSAHVSNNSIQPDSLPALIQSVFGRPIHERYGSRDAGLIAFQVDPDRSLELEVDWANVLIEPDGSDPVSSIQEPIVQPEVLFPYLKSWHLIGTCRQRGRIMVFDLDNVVAVTAAVGV